MVTNDLLYVFRKFELFMAIIEKVIHWKLFRMILDLSMCFNCLEYVCVKSVPKYERVL